jgi:hypothetical protein
MAYSNPDRRIKLTITTQLEITSRSTQSYRLTAITSDGNLIPNEVFRFVRIPEGVGYPVAVDKYIGICTPAELTSLPIDDPDLDSDLYWFRKSSIDITLDTSDQAQTAVELIVASLLDLKKALDYTDNQTQPSSFWIGTPPA